MIPSPRRADSWPLSLLPLALTTLVGLGVAACNGPEAARDGRIAATPEDRPNILLIVADDLGYADLGSYGSDIRTPNLDALAARGVRFTRLHTAPMCAPTRAMLLTGNNNHVAGMGAQSPPDFLSQRVEGYEGHLSNRVPPFPRLLREAGYHTYSVGKWHLGTEPEHSPPAAGFERSFNLVHGAANHFNDTGFFEGGSLYREGRREVEYPEGRYTTNLFTDRLIDYIDSGRGDGRPFFAYAAYTSPHWPLQVPEDWRDRYRGRFDQGYDALRRQRFRSLKEAGIIPASQQLPPRNDEIRPWEELTPEEQRREARKMELYAAMVENLDHHVGRLLDYLKAHDLYDNTLVVFLSDNGAAGEDFYNTGPPPLTNYVRAHYDNSYENMGRPDSWVSYGPQWAEAGSAPFSRYKTYTREGGIVAPMIVAGPGVERRGAIEDAYATVMDVAPTLLEAAGVSYPAGDGVRPMRGESMTDVLSGATASVHGPDYTTTLYHRGRAFLRQGPWKIVTLDPPFRPEKFELFNLADDPGETTDLSEARSELYERMLELFRERRRALGIVLPGDL